MQVINGSCTVVQTPGQLPPPCEPDTSHILERHEAPIISGRNRPVYWYDYRTGQIVTPTGRATIPTSTSLITILEKIERHCNKNYEGKRAVTLYLVAGRDEKNRPGWTWLQDMGRGWKLSKPIFKKICQADYEHDSFHVHLYSTGNYVGEEKNLDAIIDVWKLLEEKLSKRFGVHVPIAATPSALGRELLHISLPGNERYARLNDETRDLIYHNLSYQARIETFPPHEPYILKNGVYVLDAKWMYASCVSHLPVGPYYRDDKNEFLGLRTSKGKLAPSMPAFYNVTVTVPDNWHHIGLMKAPYTAKDGNAVYPNTPGLQFTNWTSAAEVALMLDNPLNIPWHVYINERLYWPDTDHITDPLANWIRYLKELRAETDNQLFKDSIRSIVLHTIGSFLRVYTIDEKFIAKDEPFPDVQIYHDKIWSVPGGDKYYEVKPLGETRQPFIHPEWPATVYGRARAKLNEFALHIPYEDIVSLRTDSVWTASLPPDDTPGWMIDKSKARPGDFIQKDKLPGPFAWPLDGAKMRAIAIKRHIDTGNTEALQNELESDVEE